MPVALRHLNLTGHHEKAWCPGQIRTILLIVNWKELTTRRELAGTIGFYLTDSIDNAALNSVSIDPEEFLVF